MAYALDSITKDSPDTEKQQALMQTVAQMVQEGMSEDDAKVQALQMLQDIMRTPAEQMNQKTSDNMGASMMNPNSRFVRGGPNYGVPGSAMQYKNVPNVRLNNFNPMRPSGYERVN